jgi:hypothetical protein
LVRVSNLRAAKQKRYRARHANGFCCVEFAVDPVTLAEFLTAHFIHVPATDPQTLAMCLHVLMEHWDAGLLRVTRLLNPS